MTLDSVRKDASYSSDTQCEHRTAAEQSCRKIISRSGDNKAQCRCNQTTYNIHLAVLPWRCAAALARDWNGKPCFLCIDTVPYSSSPDSTTLLYKLCNQWRGNTREHNQKDRANQRRVVGYGAEGPT